MKKLITFLGSNKYRPYSYEYNGVKSDETKFIQKALLDLICKNWEEDYKIIIFVTKTAKEYNWEGKIYEDKKGLKDEISDSFKDKIKLVDIPDGNTVEEIWEIFKKVVNEFKDKDEIYLDITHSFRYLPMLVSAIIDYAKITKNIEVKKIFYGNIYTNPAKIMELQEISVFLDWAKAIDKFLSSGFVEDLYNLSRYKNMNLFDNKNVELERLIKDTIGKIKVYSEYLSTVRGVEIDEFDYDEFKENLKKVINGIGVIPFLSPLIPLLYKIEDLFRDFKTRDKYNTFRAVNLCLEFNLIQQAYTLLQESIITIICKDLELDHKNKNIRGNVSSALYIYNRRIPKDKWRVTDKNIINTVINYIEKNNLDHLVRLYDKLTNYRNNINHAGFNENKIKPKDIKKKIKGIYEEMSSILL
ncbi:TIGR02221 family CRISPR-associated protein [Methanocaldococcus sp.]